MYNCIILRIVSVILYINSLGYITNFDSKLSNYSLFVFLYIRFYSRTRGQSLLRCCCPVHVLRRCGVVQLILIRFIFVGGGACFFFPAVPRLLSCACLFVFHCLLFFEEGLCRFWFWAVVLRTVLVIWFCRCSIECLLTIV